MRGRRPTCIRPLGVSDVPQLEDVVGGGTGVAGELVQLVVYAYGGKGNGYVCCWWRTTPRSSCRILCIGGQTQRRVGTCWSTACSCPPSMGRCWSGPKTRKMNARKPWNPQSGSCFMKRMIASGCALCPGTISSMTMIRKRWKSGLLGIVWMVGCLFGTSCSRNISLGLCHWNLWGLWSRRNLLNLRVWDRPI